MSSSRKKSVAVTGCSTGIGEEIVKLFAKKDWTVFAGVRKETDAERLRNLSPNIKPLILDVTKQDQVDAALDKVRVATGEDGLDLLINNAGLGVFGPAEFIPFDDIYRQYDINVFGLIRVCQAFMLLLRIGKPGRIINISSQAPSLNIPHGGIYCATKSAVDSFSVCFRRELMKWGIKVIVVKPGPVKTPFIDRTMQQVTELQKKFPPNSPFHKLYGESLKKFPNLAKKTESMMASPSACSSVVYAAATSSYPRSIYFDTWGTYFSTMIISWIPSFIMDNLMASTMG